MRDDTERLRDILEAIERVEKYAPQGKTPEELGEPVLENLELADRWILSRYHQTVQKTRDYLEHPTSYDGEDDLSEFHPNVSRPDIFPELRNLTEDDVYNVAAYMLVAPRLDERWGGTIYF